MIQKKNEELDSDSLSKNRLIYETIKKKLNFNNSSNNSGNIYNSYMSMKMNKDKNMNILNKTFISNTTKNNLNNNSKKKKKSNLKVSQYASKINNYYNKYTLNNNIKGSGTNKNMNLVNKKRGSIPDNKLNISFNNKYNNYSNKYQTLYKSKIESTNNTLISKTNNNPEKIRAVSINNRNTMIKNNSQSNENLIEALSQIQEKKEKIINIFKNNKKISSKEQAFYILSTSPILRLSEQIIFSRASKNVKKVLPIETLYNNHSIFMNIKVKELIEEIGLCEKRIKMPFSASKIADITLNFITSLDEQEFKDFDILESNKELVNYYYFYIKLLYILFDMNYNENLDEKQLKSNLFEKVKEKGFKHIRDYLYHLFIAKKGEINIMSKIDIINNEIINIVPNLLNLQDSFKICRFYAFANYLIREIVNYGNNMKNIIELKFRAQNFLDIVLYKIEKLQNKKSKLKQKKNKVNY